MRHGNVLPRWRVHMCELFVGHFPPVCWGVKGVLRHEKTRGSQVVVLHGALHGRCMVVVPTLACVCVRAQEMAEAPRSESRAPPTHVRMRDA